MTTNERREGLHDRKYDGGEHMGSIQIIVRGSFNPNRSKTFSAEQSGHAVCVDDAIAFLESIVPAVRVQDTCLRCDGDAPEDEWREADVRGVLRPEETKHPGPEYRVRFDGPPGPVAGRFVELENEHGEGIGTGRWEQSGGYWILVLPTWVRSDEAVADYRTACAVCERADGLNMYAVRRVGSKRMIGWLFACPLHADKIAGADPAELFSEEATP